MTEIAWITVMSIILVGVLVKAYFVGYNKGYDKAEHVNGLIERGIAATSNYIQNLKDRGCDVDCSGRIPLDKRTDDKLDKIGYGHRLRKDKKQRSKELAGTIKELQGSPCLKCHDLPTCQERDGKKEKCAEFWNHIRPEDGPVSGDAVEQTAQDEQDDTEAREEVEESAEEYRPGDLSQVLRNNNHKLADDMCQKALSDINDEDFSK